MKQIVSTAQGVRVVEVPAPTVQPGHVVVEVEYSFVSSGTELASLAAMQASGRGVAGELAENPGVAKKVMRSLRAEGVRKTVSTVLGHMEAKRLEADRLVPLGYSCAGRVVGIGDGVTGFQPGDRVACAGANRATHSELVDVPESLVTPVPRGCDMKSAASVAIGAIAMQGVRRADVRLGERVAVIGLGLVGLIAVQLLKLSGAQVIGFDTNRARVDQALQLGADEAHDDVESAPATVAGFTEHMGVDATLVTASSKESDIVQTAMESTRKKGKVVVVGIVGMDIERDPFLAKEIDFLVSASYGPGRYDDLYEEKGVDYPYAYVRWTERRNMEEYLRLLGDGRLDVTAIAEKHPLESAEAAYQRLEAEDRPAAVVIRFPTDVTLENKWQTRVDFRPIESGAKLHIGVAGAGSFVRRTHLPALSRMSKDVELVGVLNRSGASGAEVARQFDFGFAATSYDELLEDSGIGAILIGTRHDTHAGMVLQALKAGKHVLVEKPLSLTEQGLAEIEAFYAHDASQDPPPLLLTGFNRRFAPLMVEMKTMVRASDSPVIMDYQMNVGHLPADHWLRSEEGGGRNLGEACHIYDVFTYLTDSRVVDVKASHAGVAGDTHGRNENFCATATFDDGSVGTLTFTSLGSSSYAKEILHVYAGEGVHVLTDYRRLEAFGATDRTETDDTGAKGHKEELKAFVDAARLGGEWPIPLWQQLQASRIALEVERQVAGDA